jgi:hypothetical protein
MLFVRGGVCGVCRSSFRLLYAEPFINNRNAEQNGCRQRLEGYLSCQQRLALAVA